MASYLEQARMLGLTQPEIATRDGEIVTLDVSDLAAIICELDEAKSDLRKMAGKCDDFKQRLEAKKHAVEVPPLGVSEIEFILAALKAEEAMNEARRNNHGWLTQHIELRDDDDRIFGHIDYNSDFQFGPVIDD